MSVDVGLDRFTIALMTSDTEAGAVYDVPERLAKAIEATMTPNENSNTLFADNGPAEVATAMGTIDVSISIDQLPASIKNKVLGVRVNADGVLEYDNKIERPYLALGFRSLKSNGKYGYYWLLKGKFNLNEESFATKGDTPEFNTKTLTATFVVREFDGMWKYEVEEGAEGVSQAVIDTWFDAVYAPTQPAA